MRTSRLLVYDFYIRSARKRQLAYAIVFIVMLLYAVINGIFLKRAEPNVAFEVVVLTVLMVSASPVLSEAFVWLSKRAEESRPAGEVIDAAAAIPFLRHLSDVVASVAIFIVVGAGVQGIFLGAYGMLRIPEYIMMGVALYLGIEHFLLRRRKERGPSHGP